MHTKIGMALTATALAGAALAIPASATHAAPAPSHPTQVAKPAWHVTMTASRTTMNVGQNVWLRGHVNKSAAGHKVVLQQQWGPDKPWAFTGKAVVKSDGSYKVGDSPTQNHWRYYRVVMPASDGWKRGVSPSAKVVVYKWVPLVSLVSLNAKGFTPTSSVNINGTTYPASLRGTPVAATATTPAVPVSIEYNLDHKAIALRATFGLSDDSATGAEAGIRLAVDGTQMYTGTFTVGESTSWQMSFPVAPFRLHVDGTSLTAGLDTFPAIGSPQVLYTQ